MNQKKIIQFAVIIVIAVWISCLSYAVSNSIAEKQRETTSPPTLMPAADSTTLDATSATTAATTTTQLADITTQPLATIAMDGNNVTTTVGEISAPEWQQIKESQEAEEQAQSSFQEAKDNIPSSKAEIIKAYIKGINSLKNGASFSMYKEDTLNIYLDKPDNQMVKGIANSLIADAQNRPSETYNFSNGTDAATGKTAMEVIAPLGLEASLSAENVLDARSAINDTAGGYTIKLLIADEHQIYPETAPFHSKLVEVISSEDLAVSGMTINTLDILYSGTTIEAQFDSEGRITKMIHYLPVSKAVGNGTYIISLDVELHGDFTSVYTFTY